MLVEGTTPDQDDGRRRHLLRSLGTPNSVLDEFDLWDDRSHSPPCRGRRRRRPARPATERGEGEDAFLEPNGATGLVLLAAGRYMEDEVDVDELVGQAHAAHGFWVGLAVLPRSHPFTVGRLEMLYQLGLFRPQARPALDAQV